MTTGEKIRFEREKRGWTQLQAAKILGISNAALSNYERDARQPDFDMLRRFASVFETTTDYLLGYKPSAKKNQQGVSKQNTIQEEILVPVYQITDLTKPFYSKDNHIDSLPIVSPHPISSSEDFFYLALSEDDPGLSPFSAGDLILFKRQNQIIPGGLMIAESSEKFILVGRFHEQNNRYFYISENPVNPPLVLSKQSTFFLGKAVSGVLQIHSP